MRRLAALLACTTLVLARPSVAHASGVAIATTYSVGSQPFAVVGAPDGDLYVANSGYGPFPGGTISVIDPSAGTVSSIDTTKPAGLLALDSAAGRLYSSNYDANTGGVSVDQIDLSNGSVIETQSLGGLGVAVDPTVSRVLVAGGGIVYALDTNAFLVQQVRRAPTGASWFGAAVDPGLHHLYLTNIDTTHPSVAVLDDRDLTIVADIPLPTVPRFALAVDALTHRVFVGGSDPLGGSAAALYAIDGTSLAVVASAPAAGFPGALALSPARDRLWMTDMQGDTVTEFDATSLAVTTPAFRLGSQPSLAGFGADGRLYVSLYSVSSVAALTVVQNSAPVIDSVSMSTLTPRTNDVVTATVVAHDPDGDPITVAYQWYVNTTGSAGQQQPIAGETSASLDLSKPGNGDLDDLLCLSVVVSDALTHTDTLWCFAFVVDTPPTVSATLAPTSPTTDATLQATAVGADVDGTAVTYSYTWKVNGAVRRTAVTSLTTDTFDLSLASNGDRGDVVSVVVVADDGRLSSAPATATVTVADSAPTVSVSVDDATPGKHDIVTATASTSDADHDALTYSFVWRQNGTVVATATGASSTSALDVGSLETEYGDVLTVTVTVSDGSATASAATSAVLTIPNKR